MKPFGLPAYSTTTGGRLCSWLLTASITSSARSDSAAHATITSSASAAFASGSGD